MLVRCEPLWPGDDRPTCGRTYDDAARWTICPHPTLDLPPPGPADEHAAQQAASHDERGARP